MQPNTAEQLSPGAPDLEPAPGLYNADLAPTRPGDRTWGTWHIAALWIGMSVCITTYTLSSSLIQQGMSWWEANLTVLLGNCIVLVPMVLNAHAGTQYGIPFPVLARASFGVRGANVPAMLRALVACGWFGIQTWIGGWAIYQLVAVVWPGIPPADPRGFFPGVAPFACFIAFWLVNVYFIWKGTESIKWMESLASPFLIACGLALLLWAHLKVPGGLGAALSRAEGFSGKGQGEFWSHFVPGLTAMVGYWATLSLNIPDFSRYAKSQKAQAMGQALGLPTTMVLFSFIGSAVTSVTQVLYGEAIWDPVQLVAKIGTAGVVAVSLVALSVATLSTNIAANVVSPANDFSNLSPRRISFKTGGYITAFAGIAMMPWRLYSDPAGYIFTWLIGYSALLGPIGGILISDYFLVRRRKLDVGALYRDQGPYRYASGYNPRALIALAVAIAPNVPGFLGTIGAAKVGPFWSDLYGYAWFTGFLLAGALYWALMLGQAGRADAAAPAAAPAP